jgi:hypothetical protein
MSVPPNRLTSLPTTVTEINGVPFVGKSKNVFQSSTLLASPTNKSAFVISSQPKVNGTGTGGVGSIFILVLIYVPNPSPNIC